MRVLPIVDSHSDARRDLSVWRPDEELPRAQEEKILVVKEDEVKLGNHSHPYSERYLLASGHCVLFTWTKAGGKVETHLEAPVMLVLEPHEEHLFVCSEGMILVGFTELFDSSHLIPATHLS